MSDPVEVVRVGAVKAVRRRHKTLETYVWELSGGSEDRAAEIRTEDIPRLRTLVNAMDETENRIGGDG